MSGEKQDDRKVIDQNTRDAIASGVDPRKAQQMARESMIRTDRRLREEGKR